MNLDNNVNNNRSLPSSRGAVGNAVMVSTFLLLMYISTSFEFEQRIEKFDRSIYIKSNAVIYALLKAMMK